MCVVIRKVIPVTRFKRVCPHEDPAAELLGKYRGQIKKNDLRVKDKLRLQDLSMVVLDTETTGLRPHSGDEVISVGACRIKGGEIEQSIFHSLVNPGREIPRFIADLTGISDEMVSGACGFCAVAADLMEFIGDSVIIGHSIDFDINFLNYKLKPYGVKIKNFLIDTVILSRALNPHIKIHTLDSILSYLGIYPEGRHTSLGDALLTAGVFLTFQKQLEEINITTLFDLRCYIRNALLYKF
ncbi:MAG TPA: DNA polymerase III subunit epsilon [Desulfotomaculum sp.]|nr:DNA polymerase III subunit epsilon [Desulfotomaculum sp.]